MSRDAFLARMALGRSPYEAMPEDTEAQPQPVTSNTQQYNSKREPFNASTKRHNEAMIAAKNEVLAAVGVCEKKDQMLNSSSAGPDSSQKQRVTFTDQEWRNLKEAEDDYGELIRITAETARNILTWWLMGLRRRLQIGIVSSDLNFTEILSGQWIALTSNGILEAIKFLTVGGFSEVVSQLIFTTADWWIGEQVLQMSKNVIRLKASTRSRFLMLRCVNYSYKAANALLYLSIYPMASFCQLQQLGLISSSNFLPPKAWLEPWSAASPLRWAFWDMGSLDTSRLKGFLFSPAGLWLTMTLLQHSAASTYGHTPLFEQSNILGPHNTPTLPSKPDFKLLVPLYDLRDKFLQMLGWAPDPIPNERETQDLTDTLSTRNHGRRAAPQQQQISSTRHRVTELSMAPAHLLALNLDYLFWTILLLPLDTSHLRALVSRFSGSVVARNSVEQRLVAGMVGGLATSRSARANKVGLCLALEFTLDTAVWGASYLWAKYMGTSRYHWGRT